MALFLYMICQRAREQSQYWLSKEVHNTMKKALKGFTLIELMVVVVILGILAVVVAPRIPDLVKKANEGATKGALSTFRSSLNIYYSDVEGFYPMTTLSDGTDITASLSGVMVPKYLKKIPDVKCPTAHAGTGNSVYAYSDVAMSSVAAGAVGAMLGTDGNAWGYCGIYGASNFGNVIVNCSHTDTSNKTWCMY